MSTRSIVILGNGITGITAARNIRKRSDDDRITVVSGETDHHFSRTALMYIFMGDMTYADTKPYEDGFWPKNRIELKRGWVDAIDTTATRLTFSNGDSLPYDELIIATGSQPNRLGWPGQDLQGVQGLYSLQDLESMEKLCPTTKRAVIAGGGLIGVEVAEMLLTRGIAVTFLVREKSFWGSVLPEGESKLVGREILRHGIDLSLQSEIQEILPDAAGRARAVKTKAGDEIPCEMVFLTAGVSPNIAVARAAGVECDRGVLVDEFFRTATPHVWAGGDCAQHRTVPAGRRPVEQVWYTGKLHGEHIAANICGESLPYQPGIWFNSAKFFDIEYQTYGTVLPKPRDGEQSFYWEHPDGDKSIRVNFRGDTGELVGVNVFGIRHRHLVWEHWIAAGTTVTEAMSDLGAANFDPEFFRQYEPEIVAAFNAAHPQSAATLRTRKGLFTRVFQRLFKSASPRGAVAVSAMTP
ncbi:FAD-dependent oxidoreductase [Verrucomicrobia bacterium LW23]|nr:FAD-dependent oxidoreductase [Verrucomicrobia bacterium LW23]